MRISSFVIVVSLILTATGFGVWAASWTTDHANVDTQVVSTDRSALLWMYCREIAPYETPTFIKNVGELIARATSASQKRGARARRIRPRVDEACQLRRPNEP